MNNRTKRKRSKEPLMNGTATLPPPPAVMNRPAALPPLPAVMNRIAALPPLPAVMNRTAALPPFQSNIQVQPTVQPERAATLPHITHFSLGAVEKPRNNRISTIKERKTLRKKIHGLREQLKELSHEEIEKKREVTSAQIGVHQKKHVLAKEIDVSDSLREERRTAPKKQHAEIDKDIADVFSTILTRSADFECISKKLEKAKNDLKNIRKQKMDVIKSFQSLREEEDPSLKERANADFAERYPDIVEENREIAERHPDIARKYGIKKEEGGKQRRKTRKIKKCTTRSNKSRVYASRTPKVRTSALFK